MERFINQIINDDCFNILPLIPDKSIDMILCDLPYGTTRCSWDTILPFNLLWREYERIIKPNAAIVLFGSEPFSSYLRLSNIKLFKYDWIWSKSKPTGFLNANKMPFKKHEIISVFSVGKCNYYPQDLIKIDRINYAKGKNNVYGKTNLERSQLVTYTNYPKSIIEFDVTGEKLHPTQKPVKLFEYLIKTYTNESGIILDNCIGSGTTAIAAINVNRKFIGIEKDLNYYNIAVERIRDCQVSTLAPAQ